MATSKPRITITMTDHQYEVVTSLASIRGVSRSSVVTEMLEAALPALERTHTLLEALEKAKKGDYLEDFVQSLERAEATLAPMLAAALEQIDMPLAVEPPPSNTGVTPSDTSDSSTPKKGSKRPPRAASRGDRS